MCGFKKISIFLWLMLLSVCIVSCGSNDEPSTEPDVPTPGVTENVKRISKIYFSDSYYGAGSFNFEWNDEGKLYRYYVNIYQNNRNVIDHTFTYSDNKVIVTGKGIDGNETYTYALNSNGLARYCELIEKEELSESVYRYDFTYNSSGYLTKIDEGDYVQEFLYSNNSITQFTETYFYSNGDTDVDIVYFTNYEYENKSGIHNFIFEEACHRHIGAFYAGILGKPSQNLFKSIKYEESDDFGDFTYEFDEDGYLVSEKEIDQDGEFKIKQYSYE